MKKKPKNHYEPWAERDDDFLARKYNSCGVTYIANKLGRSKTSVRRRAVDLGITKHIKRRLWITNEEAFLREH